MALIFPFTPESLERAASRIQTGELVAFPTETVYGLGANALDVKAVEKIFHLKRRPRTNPLIVHLPSAEEAAKVFSFTSSVTKKRFEKLSTLWPGPLSLVGTKASSIPLSVTAGGTFVAARVPRHSGALDFLRACKVPVAAPSANPSTYVSPTTAAHVEESFPEENLFILDGGPCSVGIESTVLLIEASYCRVLRPGSVTRDQIEEVLGEKLAEDPFEELEHSSPTPSASPGMMKLHYAPKAKVFFLEDAPIELLQEKKTGLILFSPKPPGSFPIDFSEMLTLSKTGNLEEASTSLFAALRQLDASGCEAILVEPCPEEGIGEALMDRLRRAAAPRSE